MNNTVVSDDQAYWISLVNLLNRTISQYGLGLIWLIGNIGSVLTCIVFCQPAFRSSPCAMYFTASGFSQLLTFNFALLTRMLQFGYNVQAVNTLNWFCKVRYYFFYIFVAIPRYNIILASIDRFLATSRDALLRQWSSQKIAYRLIIGNIILWCLIYVQVLIFYEIENGRCLPRSGPYAVFFSIYLAVDSGILPLGLMIIFGSLTVKHVNQTKQRIVPTAVTHDHGSSVPGGRMSKKDSQLYRMLANEICIFVILDVANPCYLVYRSLTINTVKSTLRSTVELFIENMSYVLVYLGFALTFINFFVSSKMFRRELQQVIQTKVLRRPVQASTTNGATARVVHITDIHD